MTGLTALLISLFVAAARGVTVWQSTDLSPVVAEGSTVSMVCSGDDNDADIMGYRIEKVMNGQSYRITTFTSVDPFYENTGRYHLHTEKQRNNNKIILNFTITDAQGEDSGLYKCYVSRVVTGSPLNLTVTAPVHSVKIGRISKDGDQKKVNKGEVVVLGKGQSKGVTCHVRIDDSPVVPDVTMTVGGKDVTKLFTSTFNMTLEEIEMRKALYLFKSKTILVYEGAPTDWNLKDLTCSAFTKGTKNSIKTASARISVEFRPVVTCKKPMYAIVDERASVKCTVRANPQDMTYHVWLRYDDNGVVTTLEPDYNKGPYGLTLKDPVEDTQEIEFVIHRVTGSDFSKSYELHAENKVGSQKAQIKLIKGVKPDERSRASDVTCVTVLLVISTLLALSMS